MFTFFSCIFWYSCFCFFGTVGKTQWEASTFHTKVPGSVPLPLIWLLADVYPGRQQRVGQVPETVSSWEGVHGVPGFSLV